MNDINYYGKTIYYIIIYIILITSIIIIIDEIIKMTRYCYNYTYNYNYGTINENLCQNDENTGIIEYEKARFRVLNNINKYKFENDLFNKTWINYIKYLIIIILTIIAFIIFGTIFYYFFIDKINNCDNDIQDESQMSIIKLFIKCTFGDLHKFIPNCTINYFILFIIVIYYPLIILLKSFLNIDFTWSGGFWSKGFHIFISILLFLYIILLLREKTSENTESGEKLITSKDKYIKILIYTSFISIFYLAQYIYNDVFDEYNNQYKNINIYNNENNDNDAMFFDIYKQQEPIKPVKSDILINLPKNNRNLLLSFKYCSSSELNSATFPPYCGRTKDEYKSNLTELNKYYREKKEYEEQLKNYTNKYNIYKYNKIEFPEIITVFNSIIPSFLGFDKTIFIIIYIFIAIFVLIFGILKFYNSNYSDYYYNTVIIYLIGLISIYILINSLLNYNTYFNKYLIYEPLAYYKYDIYKINILFDLAIKNTQTNTNYANKLVFYEKITGKNYKQTYSQVSDSITDINDIIEKIKNNSYTLNDLNIIYTLPGTTVSMIYDLKNIKLRDLGTKTINYNNENTPQNKQILDLADQESKIANNNFNNKILKVKLINAIYIGLYSSLLYLKDVKSDEYTTKYIENNYWMFTDSINITKFDFYYPLNFNLINSENLETSSMLNANFYNFIQIIKGTVVNNINNIDSKINRINNNIKYLIYTDSDSNNDNSIVYHNNKLTLSVTDRTNQDSLYSYYLLKDDISESELESIQSRNNNLIKTYDYNIGTIKEITYYYKEFLIKVRGIVIDLFNSSSIYCNSESDDINIMQKLNDYIATITKDNITKFKSSTDEPNIAIYKQILKTKINEFNTIYRNYFNIIKLIIYKNINNYDKISSDITSSKIFDEVKNNYNIHNINDNKFNNQNFINNIGIKLRDKEFINKYKNINSKDKEILNLNIDSVSWGFIVLVIIFAIILLEPIII